MAAKAGRLQIQLEMQVAQLQRDLDKANRAIDSSTKAWAKSFTNVATVFAGAFLAGAAQAALASLGEALDNVMQRFDDIADGAKRVGLGTTAFQELSYAAEQSGLSMAEMEKALFKMQKGFGTASKDFQKALTDIGLSFDALSSMDDTQRFTTIVDALSKVEDTGKRAAAGAAIFGKGVQALGPLMAEGAAGIEAMIQKAHDLGIVLDEETVAAGEAFNDQMDTMQLQLQALVAKGLGPLLPQLTALSEELGKAAAQFLGAKDGASAFQIVADAVADALVWLTNTTIQTVSGVTALAKAMQVLATAASPAALIASGRNPIEDMNLVLKENEANVKRAISLAETMQKRLADIRAGRNTQTISSVVTRNADGTWSDITNQTNENTAATERNTKTVRTNTEARAKATEEKQKEFDLDKAMADAQSRMDEQFARTRSLLEDLSLARMEAAGASEQEIENQKLRLQNYTEEQIAIANRTQAIRDGAAAQTKAAEEAAAKAQQYQDVLVSGFDDIFASLTQGGDEAAEAVKRLVAELVTLYLTQQLLGMFKPGGMFGGPTTLAKGGVFDQHGMVPFAQGGIVRRPTAFTFGGGRLGVMGEAGPEAIMPLGRDSMGRLGVRGGGVTVNVHNNAGAQVSVDQRGNEIAIIVDQVRGVIANDFARGGNVVTTAFEGAYGVRR